jgi:phage terminase large subunit-like protein
VSIAEPGVPDSLNRGGGWNRKSVEEHVLDGTYRKDRHGPIDDGKLDWPDKPPGKIKASVKSQQQWVHSIADEHAVRSGCRFNVRLAEHAAAFFPKFLRHSKGQWGDQPFELTDWQRDDLIYPLFGWVRPDGTRRFRRTYIEIPKKNYKSTTASGIGLYMFCGDDEPGAEVYSMAADKDQARVVHNEAINMIEASPDLDAVLKINRTTGTIAYKATKSVYRVISGSPKGKHGFNIHCGIADELHEWYGWELWNKIKYGYRARLNPLQLVITNAGDDLQSVCYKQREKAEGIINGTIYDDSFFALVMATDRAEAESEIAAVKAGQCDLPVARKCNPGLGHVIKEDDLLVDIQDAIQTPSEMPNLLRLTYGVWSVGSAPWLNTEQWKECGDDYTEEDLLGQLCYVGLDLSQTCDMTAAVLVFPQEDGEYRQLAHFWLPAETIENERKIVDYTTWQKEGYLTAIPGAVIENSWIEAFLADEVFPRFDVAGVVYDPMYADDLTQRIEEDHGIQRIKFPQTIIHFAGPTSAYERLVISGKMRHNHQPVLTWQAGHCQVKIDVNNNKRPIKPPSDDHRKIDGMVAAIMALSQAMAPDEVSSAYNDPDKELVFL